MKKYKINTDEGFFNKFRYNGIQSLGALFQNEGLEISEYQLDEWYNQIERVKKEFEDLIDEAHKRIELVKEDRG